MPELPKSFRHKGTSKRLTLSDYTYDSKWRKLRQQRITKDPLCRHCLDNGLTTPAEQVDHIIPRADGGKDEWENTQSLCGECHRAKTARENTRHARERREATK